MNLFKKTGLAIGLGLFLFAQPASAAQTSTLLPISDGNYTQWTPSTGTSHFALVDETTCNGTTDYNATNTVGNRDSYGISLSTIPDGSTITQIDITPCASKNQNGGSNSTVNVFYRLNGVDNADAGSYSVSGLTPTGLSTTAFSSLSSVKSSSSTLEIGAVLSAGTKGVRLGRIATVITYTPLGSPTSLSASPAGSTINVQWTDTATTEDGFKIERSDNGGAFVQVATVGANITTYADLGLSVGTHSYRVRAYNAGGDSGYSNTVTVQPGVIAPTGLTAAGAGTTINLSWVDNNASESGYSIERSDNGGAYAEITTVGTNVNSYPDTGLPAGTYAYRIRAFSAGGYSTYSSTATAYVLAAPTSFTVFTASPSVSLSWTDNSTGEDGFKIERRVSGVGSFIQIKTVGANVTATTDNNRPVGTYEYRVRAYRSTSNSDYSNTDETTVLVNPNGLSANLSGTNDIQLNWNDNSSNEDGYYIERKVGAGSFTQIDSVAANVNSYLDPSLTPGTYQYRVRGFKADDTSAYSATASATVL